MTSREFATLLPPIQKRKWEREENTLAPHPFYFTVDGSSKTETINMDGKTLILSWDQKILKLIDVNGHDFFPPRPPRKDPNWNPHFHWWMILFVVVGIYLWIKIVRWIFF